MLILNQADNELGSKGPSQCKGHMSYLYC